MQEILFCEMESAVDAINIFIIPCSVLMLAWTVFTRLYGKNQIAAGEWRKISADIWKTPEPKKQWMSFKNVSTGESCRFRSNMMTADEMLGILGHDTVQTGYDEEMWKKRTMHSKFRFRNVHRSGVL